MIVSAEISLYPLSEEYGSEIEAFLDALGRREGLRVEIGGMSSLVVGEYEKVMEALDQECRKVFARKAAVFVLKLANSCPVQETLPPDAFLPS